jgi:photosystem II stability/assembly factor-like uncharacterized protein
MSTVRSHTMPLGRIMLNSQHNGAAGIILSVLVGFGSLFVYGKAPVPQRGVKDAGSPSPVSLQTGLYYALLIGNNNYKYVDKLLTPVNDANEIAQLLRERYGFRTEILLNADRNQILTALVNYRKKLPKNSNLVIYYAGHGHHDRDADEAYWLPVDAGADNNANWISADDITRDVRAIPSSHILIISDSCYSGYLTGHRNVNAAINPADRHALLAKMLTSKSRNLMSSGGDEPVADTGAPGHSIFAAAVLDSLRQIEYDSFTAADLFDRFVQPKVGGRSGQLPHYNLILNSGDEGGDFVFVRQPAAKGSAAGGSLPKASGSAATGQSSQSPGIGGWAVGGSGTILRTQDGGRTWEAQDSGTTEWLDSVAFVTPLSGWAVGEKGTILHTQDGGASWKEQDSLSDAILRSVTFITPTSGWVVGTEGTILHTEDGGDHWKKQDSGFGEGLNSVAFVTPQLGWAVGIYGMILHTEDGGDHWMRQNSGLEDSLNSVFFVTPQLGWAVNMDARIVHTEDGGRTWTRQDSGTSGNLCSVTFATPQSGWAVGWYGTILHTEDGGAHWKRQISRSNETFLSVVFSTPQSGWVLAEEGTILYTNDAGDHWKPLVNGSPDQDLRGFAFPKRK